MNRKRIRCVKCRKDYNPLDTCKFASINIPYSKWLSLIKLFELSVSARSAAFQAGVSYRTALDAFNMMWLSIAEQLSKSDSTLQGRN